MENESQSNIDNDYIISDKDIWDAQCGNGEVMKKIGDALWAGDDMERNKEQALLWYEEAATRHYVSDNLIVTYEERGETANLEKAFVFLLNSYNETRTDEGYYRTTNFINKHDEFPNDFWLDTAAKHDALGRFFGLIRFNKINLRILGINRCNDWLATAIANGNVEAMYTMGEISRGEECVNWLTEAAEHGSASALNSLALNYRYGRRDIEKDLNKAVYWQEKLILSLKERNLSTAYQCSVLEDLKRQLEKHG